MSNWWQAAAGLTPVHAWDAGGFLAGAFADRVGANALSGGVTEGLAGGYRGVSGNSNLMQLGTAISTAPDGVFVLFGQFKDEFIGFYKAPSNTTDLVIYAASNDYIYMRKDGAQLSVGALPAGARSGTPIFCALAISGSDARIYTNGAWAGSTFSKASYVQTQVAGIGWNTAGSPYNISENERFIAAGYWTGAASLAAMQDLEAACRAALEAPPFAARYADNLLPLRRPLHPFWNRPQMGFDTVAKDPMQPIHRSQKGRVVGTLFAKGDPNTAMQRKLRCFDEATGTLLAERLSDAQGNYVFDGLDPTRRVFVLAFDDQDHYRAVVADKLLPQVSGG